MQREDDVLFVSRLFLMQSCIQKLYISLLHICIALFILSQSFGVIVFLVLSKKSFFSRGGKVWASSNMIVITDLCLF